MTCESPSRETVRALALMALQSLDREGQDMSAADLGKRIQDGERWKLAEDGQINAAPQDGTSDQGIGGSPSATLPQTERVLSGAAPDFDAGLKKAAKLVQSNNWRFLTEAHCAILVAAIRALKGTK